MKDAVFSGRNVEEAVQAAVQALVIPQASLRYVVLDPGTSGGTGTSAAPARIAVLLDRPPSGASSTSREQRAEEINEDIDEDFDPRAAVRSVVRAVAEAAGIDVSAEIDEGGSPFVVRLLGPDADFFLGRGGAVLRSLEHILQRMYGYDVEPKRIVVDTEGYRDQREEALRTQARTLAAAVRKDGAPRTTDPLNSYERRIIHVALTEEPGVRTFSVGEGSNRRVTVALADGAAPDEG